jgi:hypothetical protein
VRENSVFKSETDRIAEDRQVGADDEAAVAGEHNRAEILPFADERRHRGALDQPSISLCVARRAPRSISSVIGSRARSAPRTAAATVASVTPPTGRQ